VVHALTISGDGGGRFLTPDQLEAKYGSGRKGKIMPDAKPAKSTKPSAKSKQTA
jgi:hypothetical protein